MNEQDEAGEAKEEKLIIESDDLGEEEPVPPRAPPAEKLIIESEDLAAPAPQPMPGEAPTEPDSSPARRRRRVAWYLGLGGLAFLLLIIVLIILSQRATFQVCCKKCGTVVKTVSCWRSEVEDLRLHYADTYCDRCGQEEIVVYERYYCQNPDCPYHVEPYAEVPRKVKRNSGEKDTEDRNHYCCRECRFRTVRRTYFCTVCGRPYREIETEVPRESSAEDENITEGICAQCGLAPSRALQKPKEEAGAIGGETAASPTAGREAKPALPKPLH